ncbi:MAG TPA: tachylectin-related carbohydrate-binding protein [Candidatus Angelobacter sp.]|nr:tachylectin-related carbohydrate-binding protein [Candidatus Angelobacter sp.]
MQQNANVALTTIHCVREKDSPSSPYLWPAAVVINESSLSVTVVSPLQVNDRVVIQNNLQAGQSAPIPSSVGVMSFQFDPDMGKTDVVLVVALWQKHDTPGNVVDAGFNAFISTLHDAIQSNLIHLADPNTRDTTINAIKMTVQSGVTSAIENSLSLVQKGEVAAKLLTLDSLVDNTSQALASLDPTSFTLTLGGDFGGRLLSYGDSGTPGNVSDPVVVGFGGWGDFKFLFAGLRRIYAVNQQGQLLSYGDSGTPGNVSDPVVVGFGGWLDFKFLFAGLGRIYAVNEQGQLLSYGDSGTPGNVSDPVVVGFGGWADFKFLFAGSDRIYAVNQQGQLLSYGDNGTPGNVSDPVVVGFGGWLDFKFLFGGGGRIYAAENALSPDHNYEIDCTLQVAAATCVPEQNAVNAASQTVQSIKSGIASLQAQETKAIGPEKLTLLKLIQELETTKLEPAEASLEKANEALAACRARSSSSEELSTAPVDVIAKR